MHMHTHGNAYTPDSYAVRFKTLADRISCLCAFLPLLPAKLQLASHCGKDARDGTGGCCCVELENRYSSPATGHVHVGLLPRAMVLLGDVFTFVEGGRLPETAHPTALNPFKLLKA